MADQLLQEVDDALRADKIHEWWRTNKNTLIAFIAALILGTAANAAWQHYREVKGGHMLAALSENQQLLAKGKAEDAAAGFKKIADGASGEFKDLALVWESRALFAAGKKTEAAAPLKEAVATGGNLWSDIACLRLAGLDAKAAAPCLQSASSSPLASTRAEWSAANLWASGDKDGAMASIEKQLANKDPTQDSRERLTQWLASMKAEKTAAVKEEAKPVVKPAAKEETKEGASE